MCDIKYPESLNDAHNLFPLAAEKSNCLISSFQLVKKRNNRVAVSEKKVETFFHRKYYLCQISMLQFSVQQGLKIIKTSKVLQFHQMAFLIPYNDMNTKLRQQRDILDFKKRFFKLSINSCFGKTMENWRRRKSLAIARDEKRKSILISSVSFVSRFSNKTWWRWQSCRNQSTGLRRPTLGLQFLRSVNSNFICSFMKRLFQSTRKNEGFVQRYRLRKLAPMTFIRTFRNSKIFLDFSSYPQDHFLFNQSNRKIPLKLVDEMRGIIVMEAVFFQPKAYSFAYFERNVIKIKPRAKV